MTLSELDIAMGKGKVFPTYTAEIAGITRVGFIEVLEPKYRNRFYYQEHNGNVSYTYVNAPYFSNLQEVKTISTGECVLCSTKRTQLGVVNQKTGRFICWTCIDTIMWRRDEPKKNIQIVGKTNAND